MSEAKHEDQFLTAATAGLKNDRELQLDVRAELKSHVDDRRKSAEAAGLAPEAASEEAVRAMGPAPDLATELEQANRRRMRLRGWVRLAATWLLPPLAVAVALLTTDWPAFGMVRTLKAFTSMGGGLPDSGLHRPNVTPDQRLVLHGDPSRPTGHEQQKAIMERWPTNRVYVQNYVSHLLSGYQTLGATTADCYRVLSDEITRLRPLDPDNARFDYILAGLRLDEAVESNSREVKGADGQSKTEYDFVVKDREKLDEAMALFKAGLAKPEFRRYAREMAAERLAIMGEPRTLVEQLAEIAMLAGVLLPDLSYLRKLGRTSVFYGEQLALEGRRQEADVYLNSYRILIPEFNRDSFTLIDVLVAGAIAGYAADQVPAVYGKLGDAPAAERARVEAGRLAAPIRQWKDGRKSADKDKAALARESEVKREGGILAGLLLPALGEFPSAAELAPSRLLEYGVAEGMALVLLSLILCGFMLLCLVVVFGCNRIRGGSGYGFLMMPGTGEVARLLGWGVLLPLVGYYAVTRWSPWASRDVSLLYGWPKLGSQLLALLSVMLGLLGGLTAHRVRRRCRELQLPASSPVYYGSLARTLLPVFALALILVNVCSRPYLRFEERRLLRLDTLMRPDPNGGFTSLESRVTNRLKAEMEKAAEGLSLPGR